MAVIAVYDNSFNPGVVASSYVPDDLIISGGLDGLVTQPIELLSGTLARGAVLGQVSSSTVVVSPGGTNAGTGTVGSASLGAGNRLGNYLLTATGATTFTVVDPTGASLPPATVGTPYSAQGISFTITAGGTAFVAGDGFTLLAPDTIGSFIACVKTATDGSQVPVALLADAADASGGPVKTAAYLAGEFDLRAVTYDASWTPELLTTAMRPYQIFLKSPPLALTALDPS